MESRIIRLKDVIRKIGLSPATVWRLVKAKQFPQPLRLGANAVGWVLADVEKWIANKQAEALGNGAK